MQFQVANVRHPSLLQSYNKTRASMLRVTAANIARITQANLEQETKAAFKKPSGRLLRSWITRVDIQSFRAVIRTESDSPYARIRDLGGTIRSKRPGGYLAIPVTQRARGLGSPRNWGKQLRPIKGGLVDRRGKLQYVFRKSVRHPASKYATKARARSIRDVRRYLKRRLRP